MTTDGMELEDLAPETRERLEALVRKGLDRLRGDEAARPFGVERVEVDPMLGITIRLRDHDGKPCGVGFSARWAREFRDELNRVFPVETADPKVVEIVAYQCVECRRRHVERRDAERCCRCLKCLVAKMPPGSIGYCRDCFEASLADDEGDDEDDDEDGDD